MTTPAQPASIDVTREQLERLPDASWATAADGRILFWSRGAERMLAWPGSFAQGMSCPMLVAGIGTDGDAVCSYPCVLPRQAESGGRVQHPDMVVRRADGSPLRARVDTFSARLEGDHVLVHVVRERADSHADALTGCLTEDAFRARFTEERQRDAGGATALILALIRPDSLTEMTRRRLRRHAMTLGLATATALQHHCRGGLVGRLEDEDFAVLFTNSALSAARGGLAGALREMTARRDGGLSFSAGAVVLRRRASWLDARRDADAQLYRAIRHGGRRVEFPAAD